MSTLLESRTQVGSTTSVTGKRHQRLSRILKLINLSLTHSIWLMFEVVFVYFMFPETSGRTLEELAFRECSVPEIRLVAHLIWRSLRTRRGQTSPAKERR